MLLIGRFNLNPYLTVGILNCGYVGIPESSFDKSED